MGKLGSVPVLTTRRLECLQHVLCILDLPCFTGYSIEEITDAYTLSMLWTPDFNSTEMCPQYQTSNMAIFKRGNGEWGNRGMGESGNGGIGEWGNRGISYSPF